MTDVTANAASIPAAPGARRSAFRACTTTAWNN
jgi:hypothetical protein